MWTENKINFTATDVRKLLAGRKQIFSKPSRSGDCNIFLSYYVSIIFSLIPIRDQKEKLLLGHRRKKFNFLSSSPLFHPFPTSKTPPSLFRELGVEKVANHTELNHPSPSAPQCTNHPHSRWADSRFGIGAAYVSVTTLPRVRPALCHRISTHRISPPAKLVRLRAAARWMSCADLQKLQRLNQSHVSVVKRRGIRTRWLWMYKITCSYILIKMT